MTPERQRLIRLIGAGAVALVVPLVATYEGRVLRAYRDPIGILTACYGHTGPDVQPGARYTPAQCADMLHRDLAEHAQALACINRPLTDGQAAAFLSFAYNVGAAKFCASSLAHKANAGDMAGACAELSRWTFAGDRQLPGLVKRRAAERAMCEGRQS